MCRRMKTGLLDREGWQAGLVCRFGPVGWQDRWSVGQGAVACRVGWSAGKGGSLGERIFWSKSRDVGLR